MKKINMIKYITISLLVFFSFLLLDPLSDSFHDLRKDDFALVDSGVNKNKCVIELDYGTFVVHSFSDSQRRDALFFKRNMLLRLKFPRIENGSKKDVSLRIIRNGRTIAVLKVPATGISRSLLDVRKFDDLQLEVFDPDGTSNEDVVLNLKIEAKYSGCSVFGYYIIFTLLWFCLFVLLDRFGYFPLILNFYLMFLVFLYAEKLNFGQLAVMDITVCFIFILSLMFFCLFAYQISFKTVKIQFGFIFSYLLSIILLPLPLSFIAYSFVANGKISQDTLLPVFETNFLEACEFLLKFGSLNIILFLILFLSIATFILVQQTKQKQKRLNVLFLFTLASFFFFISFVGLRLMTFPRLIIDFDKEFVANQLFFKHFHQKVQSGEIKVKASKRKNGETYIVVIGESMNRNLMGLYGYCRNNTPEMSEYAKDSGFLIFNNVYSNFIYTTMSLDFALTEANQYNNRDFAQSVTLMEIMNAAGFETFWVSNQRVSGMYSEITSYCAHSSNELYAHDSIFNKISGYGTFDAAMIKDVKRILSKKTDSNRIIFIHFWACHFRYGARYPQPEFEVFKKTPKRGCIGEYASKSKKLNSYDNAVCYVDYVMGEMLRQLMNSSGVRGLIFFSDHADDVLGSHMRDPVVFTFSMTTIPMFMWFSPEYRLAYPNKFKVMSSHKNSIYTNDLIYDTVMGITGVSTDKYIKKYDISSQDYNLLPKQALTMHGRMKITNSENRDFWLSANAHGVISQFGDEKIIPYGVDNIEKLKQVWRNLLRGFEIPLSLTVDGENELCIGKQQSAVRLNEFFENIDLTGVKKIIFNISRFNDKQCLQALKILNDFKPVCDLKKQIIIVLPFSTTSVFMEFKEAAWRTACRLPKIGIEHSLLSNEITDKTGLAKLLSQQLVDRQCFGLYFDRNVYPFVKKYLEKDIPSTLKYLIRYNDNFASSSLLNKLKLDPVVYDSRINSLLFGYDSYFDVREKSFNIER